MKYFEFERLNGLVSIINYVYFSYFHKTYISIASLSLFWNRATVKMSTCTNTNSSWIAQLQQQKTTNNKIKIKQNVEIVWLIALQRLFHTVVLPNTRLTRLCYQIISYIYFDLSYCIWIDSDWFSVSALNRTGLKLLLRLGNSTDSQARLNVAYLLA